MEGTKTATCSPLALIRQVGELFPKPVDLSVVLNVAGNAVCIIRATGVWTLTNPEGVTGFEDSVDYRQHTGTGLRDVETLSPGRLERRYERR
jgi:hypothetical protein